MIIRASFAPDFNNATPHDMCTPLHRRKGELLIRSFEAFSVIRAMLYIQIGERKDRSFRLVKPGSMKYHSSPINTFVARFTKLFRFPRQSTANQQRLMQHLKSRERLRCTR